MTGRLAGITVGHFGQLNPDHPRNRVVAKSLRRAGATVVPVTAHGPWHRRTPSLLARGMRGRLDILLVGFPGHADVMAAKAISVVRRVPVIFDPLVSLYDTAQDREGGPPGGLRGRRYLLEDNWSCRLADVVMLDTDAHIAYFAHRLGVPASRFRRVWVGADEEVMHPLPPLRTGAATAGGGYFRVLFAGTYIALHGVEHVIGAAHRLAQAGENVGFQLVGTGQEYAAARRLAADLGLDNVEFRGRVPYPELAQIVAGSDVCLGIFGSSDKARRVIPSKAFDALAAARPLLTADTPAVREALVHGVHAWLCPAGDPDALAAAIVHLRDDGELRSALARQGHELFRARFSTEAISEDMAVIVLEALGR